MKAFMAAGIGLALAAAFVASGPAARAQQLPTFRSGVDLVSFSVTALDRKGGFVTGLQQGDFEVIEDGVPQRISYFAPGGRGPDIAPLHLGALLDISGSMERDMSMAGTAAIKFLRAFDDARDMTLVDFDTEVRLARYGPSDFPSLVERIRSRRAEGYTALYDAIGVYLNGSAQLDGRRILVLYTDGGDTSSRLSYRDVQKMLKASQATVYAIGLVEHMGSAALQMRSELQRLAEITGGQAFFPTSLKDLDEVYEKIRDEIRAQYTLGYVSTNTARDGRWRKVEIKVVRKGSGVHRLRTREGYYGPGPESRQ